MAQPPTAGPPGGSRGASALQPARVHQDTARVALSTVHASRELPSWFWGALGCFSVLVVGLSVLFFVVRPGEPTASAAVPTSAGKLAAATNGTRGAAIQVEPIASPPSPALRPLAAAKPKAPRGVKVAHSPGAEVRRAASPSNPAPATDDGEKAAPPAADDSAEEEELLRPRKATAAAAREDRERPAASNDDDSSDDK